MMHPSPFDEALSRDFLNESYPSTPRGGGSSPVKNKWFYTSFGLSSSSSTTLPLSDDEEDSLQSSDGAIQIETVEFEAAVLQEKHESITEINQSLQQIHLIQQDFSDIIDYQQDDINQICWMSIDAKETADKGLEHVKKATQHHTVGTQVGNSTCFKYVLIAGMAFADATKSIVQRFQDAEGTSETPLSQPLMDASARDHV